MPKLSVDSESEDQCDSEHRREVMSSTESRSLFGSKDRRAKCRNRALSSYVVEENQKHIVCVECIIAFVCM